MHQLLDCGDGVRRNRRFPLAKVSAFHRTFTAKFKGPLEEQEDCFIYVCLCFARKGALADQVCPVGLSPSFVSLGKTSLRPQFIGVLTGTNRILTGI